MFCKNIKKYVGIMIILFSFLLGCSTSTSSIENNNDVKNNTADDYISEKVLDIEEDNIKSFTIYLSRSEDETFSSISYYANEDGYKKEYWDFDSINLETKEITKEEFEEAIKECSKITTIREYDALEYDLWYHTQIEFKNGEMLFFNDQVEVENLYNLLVSNF